MNNACAALKNLLSDFIVCLLLLQLLYCCCCLLWILLLLLSELLSRRALRSLWSWSKCAGPTSLHWGESALNPAFLWLGKLLHLLMIEAPIQCVLQVIIRSLLHNLRVLQSFYQFKLLLFHLRYFRLSSKWNLNLSYLNSESSLILLYDLLL